MLEPSSACGNVATVSGVQVLPIREGWAGHQKKRTWNMASLAGRGEERVQDGLCEWLLALDDERHAAVLVEVAAAMALHHRPHERSWSPGSSATAPAT